MVHDLKESFFLSLQELLFLLLLFFDLLYRHVPLALKLSHEVLVDFFHLLSCGVELEGNDPSGPLGPCPVDEVDDALPHNLT